MSDPERLSALLAGYGAAARSDDLSGASKALERVCAAWEEHDAEVAAVRARHRALAAAEVPGLLAALAVEDGQDDGDDGATGARGGPLATSWPGSAPGMVPVLTRRRAAEHGTGSHAN